MVIFIHAAICMPRILIDQSELENSYRNNKELGVPASDTVTPYVRLYIIEGRSIVIGALTRTNYVCPKDK